MNLAIRDQRVTLVDQVEEKLIDYFKEQGYTPGSHLPSELELSNALGVARTVLREALSRLKMLGLIESRTRRGMVMAEPVPLKGFRCSLDPAWMNEETLWEFLEFRIALEMGCASLIFRHITPSDIRELEEIVKMGQAFKNNKYAPVSEFSFHAKLFEITGNKTIGQFQEIIHPIMEFVKIKYKDAFEPIAVQMEKQGELVSHEDLLTYIKNGDEKGYQEALRLHFKLYTDYLKHRNEDN